MATIIDSLLVVLGLDSSGFDKGRKLTAKGLKDTREEADKTGATFEAFGKKTAGALTSLRNEAIGLFLAFQGTSSIQGFVSNMIASDAATGRLAANLGLTTNELSAYGLAVQSVGGDINEANNALSLLAAAREQLKLTGTTGHDREFMLMGFGPHDLDNSAKAFDKLAEAAQRMPRTQFYNLAHQLGLSDGVINLLELGPAKMRELIDARKADAAATEEDAQAAADLQAKWADLVNQITKVLRPSVYSLVGVLLDVVDVFAQGKDQSEGFNAAMVILAGTAAVIGSPFLAAAAAVGLLLGNLDTLKKAYAHLVWYTHGWFGGSDLYNAMVRSGAKNTDDLDRMIDAERARNAPQGGNPGDASTPAASTGSAAGLFKDVPSAKGAIHTQLRHAGFSDDQAKGIVAGIQAEGGGLGMATNGAFGIGQWRGARRRALMSKYGPNPSLSQQVDFLVSELRGGDPGGGKVTAQRTAAGTMESYLRDFMRPQGAHGEKMQDLLADIRRGYKALGQSAPAGFRQAPNVSIGQINLPGVRDAQGFAHALPDAIRRRTMTAQADRGLD